MGGGNFWEAITEFEKLANSFKSTTQRIKQDSIHHDESPEENKTSNITEEEKKDIQTKSSAKKSKIAEINNFEMLAQKISSKTSNDVLKIETFKEIENEPVSQIDVPTSQFESHKEIAIEKPNEEEQDIAFSLDNCFDNTLSQFECLAKSVGNSQQNSSFVENHEPTPNYQAVMFNGQMYKIVDQSIECKVCGKDFAQSKYLHHHMRFVHGTERFKCTECDFTTKRITFLKYHTNVKHKGLTFNCEFCDYKGSRKSNLKEHVATAHENKRLRCDKCDFSCTRNRTLKEHTEFVHMGIFLSCKECSYKGRRKSSLSEHIDTVHKKIRYPCNKCEHQSTSKRRLKEHIDSVHNEIKYNCKLCDTIKNSKEALSKHIQRKHKNT